MAHYLFEGSYTTESWAALRRKPQNRERAIRRLVESLGGKLVGAWLAFGERDVVVLVDLPNNISAAALAVAVAAQGTLKSARTTPLLSFAEGLQAVKKSARAEYHAPK